LRYPDDVPEQVKSERVARLIDLQRSITFKKNAERVGQIFEVLVERDATKSSAQWMGRTDGNLTIVWDKVNAETRPGQLRSVRVSQASAATLYGVEIASP
jgi:tRNA-2-methylthio-N6-dimethylallyladenosine synthase